MYEHAKSIGITLITISLAALLSSSDELTRQSSTIIIEIP